MPSVRPYLDGSPIVVGEVEIDAAVVFGDSDMNRALRGVKLGARLKQIERRPDCLRARRAASLLIVSTSQPMPKLPAANGPGFTVAVDHEIGESGAVGVVKQRCGSAGKGKGKDHCYGALLSTSSELDGRSVRAACNDRFGRSWLMLARVSFQSLRAILSGSMPAAFHQARSSLAR
jgi:hypothetical protein